MRTSVGTRAAALSGALLLLGALSGCASSVGTDDVVDQVDAAIAEAAGEDPEATDCPEDLEAEEGARTTCTTTVAGEEYDVDVEVTGIDGDTANFDVAIPEDLQGPPAVAADEVAAQITAQVTEQVGEEPEGVTCPDDLPGEVGATTSCVLTAPDGSEYDTAVEVTSVEGEQVNFSFEVAPEPNS